MLVVETWVTDSVGETAPPMLPEATATLLAFRAEVTDWLRFVKGFCLSVGAKVLLILLFWKVTRILDPLLVAFSVGVAVPDFSLTALVLFPVPLSSSYSSLGFNRSYCMAKLPI